MTTYQRFLAGELRVAVLTSWDDGHATDFPVQGWLHELGLSGTLFATTHALGAVDGECRQDAVPVVSEAQLLWLGQQPGIEIGAHTHGHICIERIESAERVDNLRLCKRKLESIVGKPVVSFAYPEGGGMDEQKLSECARDLACLGFKSGRLMRHVAPLAIGELWERRFTMPTTGELGDMPVPQIRAVLQDAAARDEQTVVHFCAHSSRILKKRDHVPPGAMEAALRALTENDGDYSRDIAWFCTQGELTAALEERFGPR